MNNVILVGRLTKDPQIQYVGNNNSALSKFYIAVDRSYINKQNEKKADFIEIEVWDRQAENCAKYLNKGSMVCVKGEIRTDIYQNINGENKYSTKIRASKVQFLSAVKKDLENKYFESKNIFEEAGVNVEASEEELPF